MHGRGVLFLIFAAVALSGCLGALNPGATVDDGIVAGDGLLQAASEPLWDNPQTFPHPAFGYPTLTNPPEEAPNRWWEPIPDRPHPDEIQGVEHLATADQHESGGGIALFGSLAIVSAWDNPVSANAYPVGVFDISDPEQPTRVSTIDTELTVSDVDTIAYPDGRLVAVFANWGGANVPVWDLTDPTEPVEQAVIQPPTTSHNVAVVPGTPILYNANSLGGAHFRATGATGGGTTDAQTEIYDLSDPEDPALVQEWQNGYGCHDITFHIDPAEDRYRAYCAGVEAVQIWDVEDPRKPEVVSTIPFHHGDDRLPSTAVAPVSFAHLALVNADASVLVVGDESGGGLAPPGCDVEMDGRSGPLGNLWFYDISDETDPELRGWISPTAPVQENPPPHDGPMNPAPCTAHFGRIVPDQDRDLIAQAFYGAGVALIDFTDPADPEIVDQWVEGNNAWDVWYHNGHLFTGDMVRGMDVLTLE